MVMVLPLLWEETVCFQRSLPFHLESWFLSSLVMFWRNRKFKKSDSLFTHTPNTPNNFSAWLKIRHNISTVKNRGSKQSGNWEREKKEVQSCQSEIMNLASYMWRRQWCELTFVVYSIMCSMEGCGCCAQVMVDQSKVNNWVNSWWPVTSSACYKVE